MTLPTFTKRPHIWLILFLAWFAILWHLSSGPVAVKSGIEIPHLDKLAHFGYFFGGAGLLSASLYLFNKHNTDWTRLLTIVILVMTSIGCLDEWHQSWIPERTGNDAQDLFADILGSLTGFLVFRRLHHHINETSRLT
jgi:VanZ family protein